MIEKIASRIGCNDDTPNIRLAAQLAEKKDTAGIAEIVAGLDDGSDAVKSDCIKVLYEIGYLDPALIVPYAPTFVRNLKSRNNRMVWGCCIALATIAELTRDYLYENIDAIGRAYETGSVITVDNCVSIFAGIARGKSEYAAEIFPFLIDHLKKCRPKEVGQHADRIFVCVNRETAPEFRKALEARYGSLTASQKKRVDAIFRKIDAGKFDEALARTEGQSLASSCPER